MPQTDSYGQNVPYPILTDKPNAQTLGQGIVEGVVPQTVMRFNSRSERGATITDPEPGMVTYVRDLGLAEMFDGTRWVTMAAGTSLWTPVTLADGFSDDDPDSTTGNNNQGRVEFRVVNLFGERALMLRGGVHIEYESGSVPNSGVINSVLLPVEARPDLLRTVPVATSTKLSNVHTAKLDIKQGGELDLVGLGGSNNPPWVSFNGVICSL